MNAKPMMRLWSAPAVAAVLLVCALRIQPAPKVNAAGAAPRSRSTLRVGMWTLWRDREVTLAPAGTDSEVSFRTCEGCAARSFAHLMELRAVGDAVALRGAGNGGRARQIWIEGPVKLAAHGETLTLRNPVTIRVRAGELEIVVTMPVESYVERVVASESTNADSLESLKALAVTVRTYALHEAHGHTDYDLCDSTHCQLLRWGAEGPRGAAAHVAALDTAGETLWFHGRRALAYFSKDCGGRTASPDEVWRGARAVPYLVSRPDPYCVRDGGREWASEITRADLTAALAAAGWARPGWTDLNVARRGESGRALMVRVGGTEIPAEQFRLAIGERLGWNKIPSTWFEVSRAGDTFLFHGRGGGHGVGLCQRGATVMAEEGRPAAQILSQYFPGAYAAGARTGLVWKSYSGEGFVLETQDAGDAKFLPQLSRARAEAAERSGLNVAAPITVRVFASSEAFRDATLAPGWLAAFTEGNWIATQPLRVLAGRKMLAATLRHEFLHALVESAAGPAAPLWLREGLVEMWSGDSAGPGDSPTMAIDAANAALARAKSEAESETAHQAAQWYAARLLARYGRGQVLSWLRSGVPGGVVAGLGQR